MSQTSSVFWGSKHHFRRSAASLPRAPAWRVPVLKGSAGNPSRTKRPGWAQQQWQLADTGGRPHTPSEPECTRTHRPGERSRRASAHRALRPLSSDRPDRAPQPSRPGAFIARAAHPPSDEVLGGYPLTQHQPGIWKSYQRSQGTTRRLAVCLPPSSRCARLPLLKAQSLALQKMLQITGNALMLGRRRRVTSGGEACPRSHQESHRQRGTAVPKSGKPERQQAPLGPAGQGNSRTTVPGVVAAIHPEMLKSLKPDSDSSSGQKIAFWNCPLFSLTPSREQTVLFASDSQILNPLFPLLVTHESDSFTSR